MQNVLTTPKIIQSILHAPIVKGTMFTVQSKRTGKDYTFKVRKTIHGERSYMHVYVERGYLNFLYLGHYYNGAIRVRGGYEVQSNAAISAGWLFKHAELEHVELLARSVNVFHTGKCIKCGRILTDTVSIQTGLGPTCKHF